MEDGTGQKSLLTHVYSKHCGVEFMGNIHLTFFGLKLHYGLKVT